MDLESPHTEEPLQRAKEASSPVREVLDEMVAAANAAGWTSKEIVMAIVERANSLKHASLRDPDPAEDRSDINEIPPDGGQLGHGETFD